MAVQGRVEMWRGRSRFGVSVSAPFVWRCPSNLAINPFPHPAHRTGRADFPHPALGQDFTRSPTPRYAPSRGQTYETKVPVKVREWICPAPTTSDLVLEAQPPTQPRRCVLVERTICPADGPYVEVVRPPAQRAIQLAHQLRGLLPCRLPVGQRMNLFDHASNALLRRPQGNISLPCHRRVPPSKRVTQKVKSNSPSGTLQSRVFSSFTVSFNLPMISRIRCRAASALPCLHRITRSSA